MITDPFFVQNADISIDGERVPHSSEGNDALILVDGNEYFGAIRAEINKLKSDHAAGISGGFFYFHNWWLGLVDISHNFATNLFSTPSVWMTEPVSIPAFELNDGSGGPYPQLINIIAEMQLNGIDVKGMGWVNPFLIGHQSGMFHDVVNNSGIWIVNLSTIQSIEGLRTKTGLRNKIIMNVKGHERGAMHLKFLICGNDNYINAYLSGLDFVVNRVSDSSHALNFWHDIGIKVNGKAVKAIFDVFKDIWNENITSPPIPIFLMEGSTLKKIFSHITEPGSLTRPDSLDPSHIQGGYSNDPNIFMPLITENLDENTDARFPTTGIQSIQVLRTLPPKKFQAYPDGVLEFRPAVKKAISVAEKYIYVEDQGLYSWEIMTWINERLKASIDLKVILVSGADPADSSKSLFRASVNNCLLKNLNSDQISRIVLYNVSGQAMHGKLILIDDHWVSIGSANFFQRSMYTDGELSIAIISDTLDPTKNFAKNLRVKLTFEHCGVLIPDSTFDSLVDWYKLWKLNWGGPHLHSLKPRFTRITVPIPYPVFIVGPPPPPDEPEGTPIPISEYYVDDADLFNEPVYGPLLSIWDMYKKQGTIINCKD